VRVEGCVSWLGGSGGDGSCCECDYPSIVDRTRCNHKALFDRQCDTRIIFVDPSECAGGLEHNHRLLDSLVIAISKPKESTVVGVVHEVELGEDTVCVIRMVGYRIITKARGPREEAIVVLFIWNGPMSIATHTINSISVEEGVVIEETGELRGTLQVGCIGIGVCADGGVY